MPEPAVAVAAAGPRVAGALRDATGVLAAAGCDAPRLDAELLLAHALGVGRERLVLDARVELDPSAVYRIMPDGSNKHVADFEYPNGLAFSPDERVLYVANTRHAAYIHRIELDSAGNMVRRSIFADMSSDEKIGVPDGMKVDAEGRVFCTGPGGTWVFAPDGLHIGTIKTPEVPANLAFGGPDMKTLFLTAHTSVYSLRMKVPGLPGHPYRR